jgi:hypothetical protein
VSERDAGAQCGPRLRENVWYIDPKADLALLVTGAGRFEVPVADALSFLRLRSHCTGHVSLAEIARRAAVPHEQVLSVLSTLAEIGVVYPADTSHSVPPSLAEVHSRLLRAVHIWREELRCTTLCNELVAGRLPTQILVGWLLEQYHLLRYLPAAFALAAGRAHGELQSALLGQADARASHADYVAAALINIGLSRAEVERSVPLLTTRLLCFQLRELLELAPSGAFILEAVAGGQSLDADQVLALRARLGTHYMLPADALEPWFDQQQLEARVADSEIAARHVHLIEIDELSQLDALCNHIHDIRHAFDLLALEVKDYHGALQGKYVPRQPVDFSSL